MSEQREDGGAAMPCAAYSVQDDVLYQEGMSLRDWFAGQALHITATNFKRLPDSAELLAQYAYEVADAMLKARKTSP